MRARRWLLEALALATWVPRRVADWCTRGAMEVSGYHQAPVEAARVAEEFSVRVEPRLSDAEIKARFTAIVIDLTTPGSEAP